MVRPSLSALPSPMSRSRSPTLHATSRPYAFDIHANSFFPLFLQLYVAQLLLAPVVTRSNWVCLWVGNTLYLCAFVQYAYVTCASPLSLASPRLALPPTDPTSPPRTPADLGYSALPFLVRTELLLFPIALFAAFYIVSLLGFNISHVVLEALFGR